MNAVDLAVQLSEHGSGRAWCRAKWLGDMARMYSDRRISGGGTGTGTYIDLPFVRSGCALSRFCNLHRRRH